MKFMDIATNSGTISYFLEYNTYVNIDKFMKWWFMDYERIIEEIQNPPEKK
jgi:hypothetical protein